MTKQGSGYSRVSMPAIKLKSTMEEFRTSKSQRRKSMNDGIAVLDCILAEQQTSTRPSLQPAQIQSLVTLRNSLQKIEKTEETKEEVKPKMDLKQKNKSMAPRAFLSGSLDGILSDSDSSDSSGEIFPEMKIQSSPPVGLIHQPSSSTAKKFRYGKKPETGVNVLFAFGANALPSPRQTRKKLMMSSKRRISSSIIHQQGSKSNLRLQKLAMRRPSSLLAKVQSHAPKEWYEMTDEQKQKLAELLSWDNLRRWDFDVFEIDQLTQGNTLLFVGWAIMSSPYSQHVMEEVLLDRSQRRPVPFELMEGYRFIDQFQIDQKKMTNFLRSIERDYIHDNPYHNNIHAADVLQTLHSLLQEMGGVKKLEPSPIQLFSVLLSAVIHDVGHPGYNNFFQQSSQSDIALCYNDQSCLENMHLALAFRKLMGAKKKSSIDIFEGMAREEVVTCRKQMIRAVLGTDMSKHFQSVNDVKKRIAEIAKNGAPPSEDETTIEILHYMMHAADISNGAKPQEMAVAWADRCLEEFFRQGDKEKELGLPVSPLCDRDTVSRPESQKGFIEFIIKPTFEILVGIMPSIGTKIIPVLNANLAFWNSQIPKMVVDGMEKLLDDFERNDGVLADDETASMPSTPGRGLSMMDSISSLDIGDLAEEESEELRLQESSEELKLSEEFKRGAELKQEEPSFDLHGLYEEEEEEDEDDSSKLTFGSLISSDNEAIPENENENGGNSDWSSDDDSKKESIDYDSEMEYEC